MAGFTFLGGASEQDWELLVGAMDRLSFAAGDEVVRAGEEDRALCLLVAGRLEVLTAGGAVEVLEAPALFGEVAFLDGRPRTDTLRAVGDGELLRLEPAAFEALAEAEPALGRAVLRDSGRMVAERLRLALEVIAHDLPD